MNSEGGGADVQQCLPVLRMFLSFACLAAGFTCLQINKLFILEQVSMACLTFCLLVLLSYCPFEEQSVWKKPGDWFLLHRTPAFGSNLLCKWPTGQAIYFPYVWSFIFVWKSHQPPCKIGSHWEKVHGSDHWGQSTKCRKLIWRKASASPEYSWSNAWNSVDHRQCKCLQGMLHACLVAFWPVVVWC